MWKSTQKKYKKFIKKRVTEKALTISDMGFKKII